MNMQAIVREIRNLPPEKQEEVVDFIEFLKTRPGIYTRTPKTNLVEFFRSSPLFDSGIDLERDNDYGREVSF